MFVARFLTALCLMTATACQIMVSKSPDKTSAVPLANSTCLSGDVYIYLSVLKTDKIPQVTWYTKKSVCSIERYNNKTETTYPFNFKGGNETNPTPWNTTKVTDRDYIMYANVYNSSGISERYRDHFSVCNDLTTKKTNSTHFLYANEFAKCNVTNTTETIAPTMSPTMSPTMAPTSSHVRRHAVGPEKTLDPTTMPKTMSHKNHTHSSSSPSPTPSPSHHKHNHTQSHSNHTHSNHTHSNHTHHSNKTQKNKNSTRLLAHTHRLYFI